MSEKKVKNYTAGFKESAVKLAVESDKTVTETAQELGVFALILSESAKILPLKKMKKQKLILKK